MGQAPGDLSPTRDVLHGCLYPLRPRHTPGPAPGDHQGGSEDQSRGAVQRDFTAAALALGAVGVIVFKTLGPSHRGHPSLHLRL